MRVLVGAGDVIGSLIDLDKGEISLIRSEVNMGVAFRNVYSMQVRMWTGPEGCVRVEGMRLKARYPFSEDRSQHGGGLPQCALHAGASACRCVSAWGRGREEGMCAGAGPFQRQDLISGS